MKRPLDEYGIPVDCGKTWYWAINRIGQIVGTGKFAWSIGNPQDPTFYVNGTGYNPECFRYIPAAPPQFPGICEHGVTEGAWCETCDKEYKEARRDDTLRCPECGYTADDAVIYLDHHLCKGTIPTAKENDE